MFVLSRVLEVGELIQNVVVDVEGLGLVSLSLSDAVHLGSVAVIHVEKLTGWNIADDNEERPDGDELIVAEAAMEAFVSHAGDCRSEGPNTIEGVDLGVAVDNVI